LVILSSKDLNSNKSKFFYWKEATIFIRPKEYKLGRGRGSRVKIRDKNREKRSGQDMI